ncbi:hypothetical protein QUC31_009443 [Theobroma cacao]
MAESKSKFESIREWVVDHKLRTVGCLWLSGITGSIAYNWSQPSMKTSVKIIHARGYGVGIERSFGNFLRLHAQALTLAALAGAAVVEYYDHRNRPKADQYAKFIPVDSYSHKE